MERSSSAGLTDCFAPEKSRRSSGTELKVHVALHYRPGRRRYLVVRTPAETCAYQHQESLVMFQSRFCRIVALGWIVLIDINLLHGILRWSSLVALASGLKLLDSTECESHCGSGLELEVLASSRTATFEA